MTVREHARSRVVGSRELAVLLVVADEGSVRRAAAALGATAAAVSKVVRQVEGRLGRALFERSAVGMALTPSGRKLLDRGREALLELSDAEEQFRQGADALSGLVRIGSGPLPALEISRGVISEAKRRWPAVCLSLALGGADDLLLGLQRGEYDIAVCHLEDQSLPEGFRARSVQVLRAVVLGRAGHPLARRTAVHARCLATYGVAGLRPYSRFLRWYREQVETEADMAFIAADIDLVAEVVSQSDMLMFTSEYLAQSLMRSHGLVAIDMRWEAFLHTVYLVEPARRLSPEVASVVALLVEALSRQEG